MKNKTKSTCNYLHYYLINIISNKTSLLPRPFIIIVIHVFDPAFSIDVKPLAYQITSIYFEIKLLIEPIRLYTYVSENKFFVILCRFETATLPANSITLPISKSNQTHKIQYFKLNNKQCNHETNSINKCEMELALENKWTNDYRILLFLWFEISGINKATNKPTKLNQTHKLIN